MERRELSSGYTSVFSSFVHVKANAIRAVWLDRSAFCRSNDNRLWVWLS